MNTTENTVVVTETTNGRRGRPRNLNLTKTVYLVDGKLRGKGRPTPGKQVFKVEIPRHDAYDATKHGTGQLV